MALVNGLLLTFLSVLHSMAQHRYQVSFPQFNLSKTVCFLMELWAWKQWKRYTEQRASLFSRLVCFSVELTNYQVWPWIEVPLSILEWICVVNANVQYHSSTCSTHNLLSHGAVHKWQAHMREVYTVCSICQMLREWTVMLWDGRLEIMQGELSCGFEEVVVLWLCAGGCSKLTRKQVIAYRWGGQTSKDWWCAW